MATIEQRLTDVELDMVELRHDVRAGRVGALSDAVNGLREEVLGRFERVEATQAEHGELLREHGQLLRRILERLSG